MCACASVCKARCILKFLLLPACNFKDITTFRLKLKKKLLSFHFVDCYFSVSFDLLLTGFVLIVRVYLQWPEEQAAEQEERTPTKLSRSTW